MMLNQDSRATRQTGGRSNHDTLDSHQRRKRFLTERLLHEEAEALRIINYNEKCATWANGASRWFQTGATNSDYTERI